MIGSMRIAWRAGIRAAVRPAIASTTHALTNVTSELARLRLANRARFR
jgi:hypothetical protein